MLDPLQQEERWFISPFQVRTPFSCVLLVSPINLSLLEWTIRNISLLIDGWTKQLGDSFNQDGMSAQFKPASLIVSGMSHLCPCLLPCSILPFIPFSAVTFRSISYRLGSSLHVEARLWCVIPLFRPCSKVNIRWEDKFSDLWFQNRLSGPFICEFLHSSHAPCALRSELCTFLHTISRLPACLVASVLPPPPLMWITSVAMEKIELFNDWFPYFTDIIHFYSS